VGLIFSNQISLSGRLALQGSAAILVGALCVAYANVLVKARARHLDPAVLAAGQMFCGLVPLLVVGFVLEGSPLSFRWTPLAIASLLYLVLVGSVLAFLLYYWLIKHVDVTKTMLISLVTPLIAVTIGMLVLDEQLTWRIAAGGAAIIFGIALVVVPRVRLA
jgi:drug/metabolite transporter (DMT)-like permease